MILKNEINQNSIQLIESSFEKKKLKPGILHIGVGNFHRSHQAYLIDEYIEKNSEFNWGIVGLNLISNSSNIINNLKKRNGDYI
jgi:mannitol-1-phosphate/altronate dehydrogenase